MNAVNAAVSRQRCNTKTHKLLCFFQSFQTKRKKISNLAGEQFAFSRPPSLSSLVPAMGEKMKNQPPDWPRHEIVCNCFAPGRRTNDTLEARLASMLMRTCVLLMQLTCDDNDSDDNHNNLGQYPTQPPPHLNHTPAPLWTNGVRP